MKVPGVEKVTPAGSLRRGRDTVGDLDILVTGQACCSAESVQTIAEHLLRFPGLMEIIAQGENKISFRQRNGMQVDVHFCHGVVRTAMQYLPAQGAQCFVASAALKMGFTLNNTAWRTWKRRDRLPAERRNLLKLKFSRNCENLGEIQAAASHTLPNCLNYRTFKDVHMHTVETMAATPSKWPRRRANAHINTWRSPITPKCGIRQRLTDERALHIEEFAAEKKMDGIAFSGISGHSGWANLICPIVMKNGYRDRRCAFSLQPGSAL